MPSLPLLCSSSLLSASLLASSLRAAASLLVGLAVLSGTPHASLVDDAARGDDPARDDDVDDLDDADDDLDGDDEHDDGHHRVNGLVAHLSGPGCRLVPAYARGRVIGLRLFGVARSPALRAAGLEERDVLVRAGGLDLTRPEELRELGALPSSPTPLAVLVERQGRRHLRWIH
jgi:hypothetical protein